jgi:non-haem Fe2+, alpha-ketoglutarate-dependent halogenase
MNTDERDLSFKPVENPNPKTLSPEQIAHYNVEGYVAPLDLYSPAEAVANREYFDRLLAMLDGGNSYALNCFQGRCEGIYDLCLEPRILDYVEDIIGPNIICWATHYFCKMPFDEKGVPWHQDASYWPLTPSRTVTVWLAIDDADEENSAMRFIPRTHNRGHLEWKKADGPVVLDQEIVGIDSTGEPFSDNLKAGQISLHADMLAHGSEPNASARRRCGLTLRFCPPEVRPVNAVWEEGIEAIICRGTDPDGYWKHTERPVGDNVKPEGRRPKNLGGN